MSAALLPDLGALSETALRLFERAQRDLEPIDRPAARFWVERALGRIADVVEGLTLARRTPPPRRDATLDAVRRALGLARADLELVQRHGAILPPAHRQLTAGIDVLRRRVDEHVDGVARV